MTKSPLSMESEVVSTRDQVSCELADEVVILSLANGEYYGLNPVAADIWALVQEPKMVRDIRDALLARYDGVTPEECTQQVMLLLEEMIGLDLLSVR